MKIKMHKEFGKRILIIFQLREQNKGESLLDLQYVCVRVYILLNMIINRIVPLSNLNQYIACDDVK